MMHISSAVEIGRWSAYAKEVIKHEALHTQYGPPGRPYEFHAYPTMMYRASRPKAGGVTPDFEGQEAGSDTERSNLESLGYVHGGKQAAWDALEKREFEIAELAANRNALDRTMSPRAQAEAAAAEEGTIQHLAAVPETPIAPKRGRGRPPKLRDEV
jgi:hypothetical protein